MAKSTLPSHVPKNIKAIEEKLERLTYLFVILKNLVLSTVYRVCNFAMHTLLQSMKVELKLKTKSHRTSIRFPEPM